MKLQLSASLDATGGQKFPGLISHIGQQARVRMSPGTGAIVKEKKTAALLSEILMGLISESPLTRAVRSVEIEGHPMDDTGHNWRAKLGEIREGSDAIVFTTIFPTAIASLIDHVRNLYDLK